MNLDEKIARSIEPLREELLALFQDGPDDASELLGLLNYLVDQVPLLQDIKTEIKQLQNNQVPQPEERKDEPEDDPRTDPPPSDPELPDLRQRAKDVVKGLDKTKRVTSALRKLLPSEDDPIPDWIKDVPWYDLVSDIYKVYKFKQIVDQGSFTTQDVLKAFMSGKDEWHKFQEEHFDEVLKILGDGIDLLNSDMEDLLSQKLPGLFQIGENVSDSLQTCCQNQTSGFQAVEDQNDTTHSKLDEISSSLGPQPSFDLVNLPSYLHNETTILRGFL